MFWYREKDTIKSAFRYESPTAAAQFAKKYGGTVLAELKVSDATRSALADYELYSVIQNSNPRISASDYVVFVVSDGVYKAVAHCATIGDANTLAKQIGKTEAMVLVAKRKPSGDNISGELIV